jgi:hypothetical protein
MQKLAILEERTEAAGGMLGLGWQSLAREHLKHDPPSPLELENAIAAIEDGVAAAGISVHGESSAESADPYLREIAALAGLPAKGDAALSREAVEQMFQRLASRAPGLPAGPRFAATLLILRELMHHLRIASLSLSSGR